MRCQNGADPSHYCYRSPGHLGPHHCQHCDQWWTLVPPPGLPLSTFVRPVPIAVCVACGDGFPQRRQDARYCSGACRKAAWANRKKAAA